MGEKKEQEDITNLKITMAEFKTDITYIREKVDNFSSEFKEFKKEIREAVQNKVERKEFLFWRNTGVAACITVIIQLLFLILDK